MFRLNNVAKRYAKRGASIGAIETTNLEIGRGEYVALVGPSGSGKTTLLSMLGGMLAPTEGEIWLDGQNVYALSSSQRAELRRRTLGFVFQSFNLVPYLTAEENVAVALMLAGVKPAEQRARSIELLTQVGLADRRHHKPAELSVGQQQRVAIARTLANSPPVILADEPTGNLDPATREDVLSLLAGFHREGRTIVVVTHDPSVAARASRVLSVSNGIVSSQAEATIAAA